MIINTYLLVWTKTSEKQVFHTLIHSLIHNYRVLAGYILYSDKGKAPRIRLFLLLPTANSYNKRHFSSRCTVLAQC
jgi:hypothetical protein